jgi:PEGA domain-containing protein
VWTGGVMGEIGMKRVIAVAACGFTLTACSSWMPSFDLPSMPSLSGGGSVGATLAIESDPPGAQASTQGGASCVTPCRLNVAATEPFTVNVALNGYVPQSVPVRVVQPEDPRLTSADGGGGPRLDPNPVYVELERAAPPPPPPRKVKSRPKRPPVAKRTAPPPASVQAPPADTPSAPTTAAAPAPPPMQPSNSAAPWPMPR